MIWYDEASAEIRLQRFNQSEPQGPQFLVAEVDSTSITPPEICGNEAGFVVTWATYAIGDDDPNAHPVFYRRYDGAGSPLTAPLRAPAQLEGSRQDIPVVSCAAAGEFVLVWSENDSISGRYFADDATSDFRIGAGRTPSVALLTNGDFAVTWRECAAPAICNVYAQRFTFSGPTDCPGDCDRDGTVTVAELVLAVDAALSSRPDSARRCLPADTNLDYRIVVDELVQAVDRAVGGCP